MSKPEPGVEEIAERLTTWILTKSPPPTHIEIRAGITAALRARDERAAKIAKTIPKSRFDLDHEPALTEQQIRNSVASAISGKAKETGVSQWLNNVVNEGGEHCRNCSIPELPVWRVLNGREIERCSKCGDEAYDAYDFDEDDPY